MNKKEIQQAIDEKIPVLIERSWLFHDKPTTIIAFCGNDDYVRVEGSDNSYEIWRIRRERPLEQMVNTLTDGISVIVGEHREGCEAVKWVKEGEVPFEWNVVNPNFVQCNEKGHSVNGFSYEGESSLWYQFECADSKCNCKKRIKASAIAIL